MKYSRQREAVYRSVLEYMDHPTAEMVYNRVSKNDPQISLGTVYRNLNLLADNGKLRKVTIANGSDRFDNTLVDHGHVVCTCCGKIEDIISTEFAEFTRKVEETLPYVIEHKELLIRGVCPGCQKQI